uniref:Uncharacterized protein n=1 Tax=Solanum tuberosum TaxID=4113 RepID=M1DD94_SOLTU
MLMIMPGQGGNNGRAQSTTSAAPAGRVTQQGNSSGTGGGDTLSIATPYIAVNSAVVQKLSQNPSQSLLQTQKTSLQSRLTVDQYRLSVDQRSVSDSRQQGIDPS